MMKKNLFVNDNVWEAEKRFPMNLQLFAEPDPESDPEQNSDSDPEPNSDSDPEPKDDKKEYTQKEIDTIVARAVRTGKRQILDMLGIKDKKVAADTLADIKKYLDSKETPEQKVAREEKQKEVDAANERAERAEAKVIALSLGAKKEYIDDILTIAMSKKKDDEEIEDVLKEMKTKYAAFFDDEEDENGDRVKKDGTGSRTKGGSKRQQQNKSFAAQIAKKKYEGTGKNSFFTRT